MRNWEKNIRRVIPYTPGEQPKKESILKLNTNENPYPPAPAVQQAVLDLNTDNLKFYPDPTSGILVDALSNYHGLEADQVFVGVGSDDVLAMAFLTFFNSKKPILFPDISYSFYSVWADLYQIPYIMPPLDGHFQIIDRDYFGENGGVVIANPNAPTGIYKSRDSIEEIIKKNQDVVVIIDEAYIDFGGESALALTKKYENLLIVQTFSKSRSMAGLRIGYAMGNSLLIKALNDIKYAYNSYTMNMPSLYLGVKSIEEDRYFKETTNKIITTREQAAKKFIELGFEITDSKTNFLFVTHPRREAGHLFQALKEHDIYVRHFPKPGIDQYLRITIGTDWEMERLFQFLERYLNEE